MFISPISHDSKITSLCQLKINHKYDYSNYLTLYKKIQNYYLYKHQDLNAR